MPRVMVLGVGNLLLTDDGVGVSVAQTLAETPDKLPGGTTIMDGGTFGLDLAPRLRDIDKLVIVDAVAHGSPPGHIGVWHGEEVARLFGNPLSVHQVGVDALLGALTLLGAVPPEVLVVGIEPFSVEPGVGLSEPVAEALPRLIDEVAKVASS